MRTLQHQSARVNAPPLPERRDGPALVRARQPRPSPNEAGGRGRRTCAATDLTRFARQKRTTQAITFHAYLTAWGGGVGGGGNDWNVSFPLLWVGGWGGAQALTSQAYLTAGGGAHLAVRLKLTQAKLAAPHIEHEPAVRGCVCVFVWVLSSVCVAGRGHMAL